MIEELHEEMAPPYKYKDILGVFGAPIDKSSDALQSPGIFDKEKKRRYWVDEKGNNCFMVYARALSIRWSEYRRYWRWYPEKECDVPVDVAELLFVSWLEVHGAFQTEYLTPGIEYEVSYVIKLKDPKYGWENEVDFGLSLPQNPMCDLEIYKRDDLRKSVGVNWSSIPVGKFTPSDKQSGDMDFMLRQLGRWKKGLVIKGVAICPKTSSS